MFLPYSWYRLLTISNIYQHHKLAGCVDYKELAAYTQLPTLHPPSHTHTVTHIDRNNITKLFLWYILKRLEWIINHCLFFPGSCLVQ